MRVIVFPITEGDGYSSPLIRARMNIFTGDLGAAERIYINQGSPDEAVRTYNILQLINY